MEDQSGNEMNIWIKGWKEAGALLEETRRARLMDLDIRQVIESLDDAFESALLHTPVRSHSGLVEMQAWFAKARLCEDYSILQQKFNDSALHMIGVSVSSTKNISSLQPN